ncbi:MAG: hypothetical protein ACLVCU_00815 [Gallintestinimicrobium sp.]|uniref:hypothetical protein n=1 Tax=Gallintestinimicrobium sp. TaxID=2981655 RepID=UPI003999A405
MDWIQQWQSKLNKQNGVAPLVRTGGSRHTGLAALPYRNIQNSDFIIGDGIIVMGIVAVLLPFTTPETVALLGYQKSRIVGRILGILLIVVGIWVGFV